MKNRSSWIPGGTLARIDRWFWIALTSTGVLGSAASCSSDGGTPNPSSTSTTTMTGGGSSGAAGTPTSSGGAGIGGASGTGGNAGASGSPGVGGTASTASGGSAGTGGSAGSAGSGGAPFDAGKDGAGLDAGACSTRDIVIVSHQNDELLFFNPDLEESIHAGHCLRTVYLTAGDAGKGLAYSVTRDLGMKSVYATMAGVADVWTSSTASFAGKTLPIDSLQGANISVVYVRLPDGGDGTGFPATGQESMTKLVAGTISSIRAVDGSNTFTRAELVSTLAALITDFRPDLVDLQELLDEFGGDHPDHVANGALSNEAQARYQGAHRVRAHRGYDTALLPANLGAPVADHKWSLFLAYAKHDENVCPGGACPAPGMRPTDRVLGLYYDWCRQQFPYFKGSVVAFAGKCVAIRGGAGVAATPVVLETCSAADSQSWTLTPDGSLQSLGLCLEVIGGSSANGTALQVAPCQNVPGQRWSYSRGADAGKATNGRFQVLTNKCMNVPSTTPAAGLALQITDCATTPQQTFWYYPAN